MKLSRPPAVGLLLLLPLATTGCRPTLLVQIETRVFFDGTLERTLTLSGRGADDEDPTDENWLAEEAGVRLADPPSWGRVTRAPGRLEAYGFFASAGELPPLLTFATGDVPRQGRSETTLTIEERTILRRWDYAELHGDPYSPADVAAALERLIERGVAVLDQELLREFGEGLDRDPALAFVRDDVRSLVLALLDVQRSLPGKRLAQDRVEGWRQVLNRREVPAAPVESANDFWDSQLPLLLDWGRREIASALGGGGEEVQPTDLGFWPASDDWQQGIEELIERAWGDTATLEREIEQDLKALGGYFGDSGIPRFRFVVGVHLPGVLLSTNGTPGDDRVDWLFREQDLTRGEIGLRCSSVAPVDEALLRLGARRVFSSTQLIQLVDLLWTRDPEGTLDAALSEAVRRGDRSWLLEDEAVPDELDYAVLELHELLEP